MKINWSNDQDSQSALEALKASKISLEEIIDKTKSSNSFWVFLMDKESFNVLKEQNLLSPSRASYIFQNIHTLNELFSFNTNSQLVSYVLESRGVSFNDIVDKYASMSDVNKKSFLYLFLRHGELLKQNILNKNITDDDIRYVLNCINDTWTIYQLFKYNLFLANYVFKTFLLDNTLLNKYNALISNDKWFKKYRAGNMFEFISQTFYDSKYRKNVLVYKFVRTLNFSVEQLKEIQHLAALTKNNLIQVIESIKSKHLTDFESMKLEFQTFLQNQKT